MDKRVLCPFCGKNISETYNQEMTIPQEETTKREYSTGSTWAGGYLKETKYINKFEAHCCENCFNEYQKYDRITLKMAMIATPLGFIAGVIYTLIWRSNENLNFTVGVFFQCLIWGVIGSFIFGIPTGIVNLLHRKKCSYKKAQDCNAVYTGPIKLR